LSRGKHERAAFPALAGGAYKKALSLRPEIRGRRREKCDDKKEKMVKQSPLSKATMKK
jgi:hypothetical protein